MEFCTLIYNPHGGILFGNKRNGIRKNETAYKPENKKIQILGVRRTSAEIKSNAERRRFRLNK